MVSKKFSELPEIEQKALAEYWQRTAGGEVFSESEMRKLLKNVSDENIEKYILKPALKL